MVSSAYCLDACHDMTVAFLRDMTLSDFTLQVLLAHAGATEYGPV